MRFVQQFPQRPYCHRFAGCDARDAAAISGSAPVCSTTAAVGCLDYPESAHLWLGRYIFAMGAGVVFADVVQVLNIPRNAGVVSTEVANDVPRAG